MPAAGLAVREAKLIQLIVFKLAEEEFAIPIGEVREIIRSGPVAPVPGSPDFVEGMINVRGEIAVVIDLKARFGLAETSKTEPKHIIITAQGKNLFALIVDEVAEILRIGADEVKPAPEIASHVERGFVAGFIIRGNRLIVLLDLVKALAEQALASAVQTARRAPA